MRKVGRDRSLDKIDVWIIRSLDKVDVWIIRSLDKVDVWIIRSLDKVDVWIIRSLDKVDVWIIRSLDKVAVWTIRSLDKVDVWTIRSLDKVDVWSAGVGWEVGELVDDRWWRKARTFLNDSMPGTLQSGKKLPLSAHRTQNTSKQISDQNFDEY